MPPRHWDVSICSEEHLEGLSGRRWIAASGAGAALDRPLPQEQTPGQPHLRAHLGPCRPSSPLLPLPPTFPPRVTHRAVPVNLASLLVEGALGGGLGGVGEAGTLSRRGLVGVLGEVRRGESAVLEDGVLNDVLLDLLWAESAAMLVLKPKVHAPSFSGAGRRLPWRISYNVVPAV